MGLANVESVALIRTYREHQERIHAGQVFPIGDEPSGTGWTGFQSLRGDEGYLVVYREHNDRPEAQLKLWNVAGRMIHCTLIAGQGHDFTAAVDASGEVPFRLDRPFSFALYAYRI